MVGKDLISRLSFNTLKRCVEEMIVSLARCVGRGVDEYGGQMLKSIVACVRLQANARITQIAFLSASAHPSSSSTAAGVVGPN